MKFWDSSALVTLVVGQPQTPLARRLLAADSAMVAWTLSDVEMRSALCRLEREGVLSPVQFAEACQRQGVLWRSINVVQITSAVIEQAKRLLATHPLRAADAMQLAAAVASTDGRPSGAHFVCFDARLNEAAMREGFAVDTWA